MGFDPLNNPLNAPLTKNPAMGLHNSWSVQLMYYTWPWPRSIQRSWLRINLTVGSYLKSSQKLNIIFGFHSNISNFFLKFQIKFNILAWLENNFLFLLRKTNLVALSTLIQCRFELDFFVT